MSATKISDLLPIPEGVTQPNAYEVFGLEGGERDVQRIKTAVRSVYRELKSCRDGTDPSVWKAAAKLVNSAKETLENPAKRAELDSECRGDDACDEDSEVLPPPDPLAGLLPGADPLAALLPLGNPLAPVGAEPGQRATPLGFAPPPTAATPPPPGTAPPSTSPMATPLSAGGAATLGIAPPPSAVTPPPTSAPSPGAVPLGVAPVPPPAEPVPSTSVPAPKPVSGVMADPGTGNSGINLRTNKRKRRRRGGWGGMLLGLTVIALLGGIGGVLHFLYSNPPTNTVNQDGGPTTIASAPAKPKKPNQKPSDGVMGEVAASGRNRVFENGDPSDSRGSGLSAPQNGNRPVGVDSMSPGPKPARPDRSRPDEPRPDEPRPGQDDATMTDGDPSGTDASMQPDGQMNDGMTTDGPSVPEPAAELTPAELAENEKVIETVMTLVRNADWAKMKTAATALTERSLSDEQSARAEALYNIADLATYFHGGIGRGIGTLKTASTFELAEGIPVIVVERGVDSITIMLNRKQRSYTIDTMPFRMAETLAAFSLNMNRSDSQAGAAIFQCVSPKSSPEYRADAIDSLSALEGEVDQVDISAVIKMLGVLYPDN